MKGEPKWDIIIAFSLPLNLKKIKIKGLKLGKQFLNRLKLKL